jgi:Domain of unknown function (DUF1707)
MAMTGELPSAGDGRGAGARPELRASHDDRDRAVEILRVAAGDGRLTAAELDERLDAALTARTNGELAVLTADLPAVGSPLGGVAPQAQELVRIDCQGASAERVGRWVVPQRMEIRAVGASVKLDFTEALITEPILRINAAVQGGSLVLVTKPGVEVQAGDVALRGGSVKIRPHDGPARPVLLRVEVSGEAHGGTIKARPPQRTFWQWLRRQPRPHYA